MSTAPFHSDYRVADWLVDFAAAHGLSCRGHNLLWYWSTPKWFKELSDRATARTAMLRRVTEMVSRYRGRIDSWDVVNEPVDPGDDRADHLRADVFLKQVGPEYLSLAYTAARAADPEARLVLNECGVEYDTPDMDRKRGAVLDLLEDMRKRHVPIDALGIQAHLSVRRYPFSEQKLRDYLRQAAAMGLEIQITELDCTDELAPPDIPARDRLVADEYRRFLDVALDEPAVKMVMSWDCRIATAGSFAMKTMPRSGARTVRKNGRCRSTATCSASRPGMPSPKHLQERRRVDALPEESIPPQMRAS